MPRFDNLRVYHLARHVLRDIASITADAPGFGDLTSQMRRAAVSVVSNICEGSASGQDKQFLRYLNIARSSCNELQGQLAILSDLGYLAVEHPVFDQVDHLGRSLSKLMRSLSG